MGTTNSDINNTHISIISVRIIMICDAIGIYYTRLKFGLEPEQGVDKKMASVSTVWLWSDIDACLTPQLQGSPSQKSHTEEIRKN